MSKSGDFADRWYRADCKHLKLEEHFYIWLCQAKKDIQHLTSTTDAELLCKLLEHKFSLRVNQAELKKMLGANTPVIVAPKTHVIGKEPAKPWRI